MIRLGLVLTGSRQAADRIRQHRVQHENAYRAAVYLFAQEVVSTAQKLCPVDTGFLRKSRFVRRPEVDADRFEIECGFSAPYAMTVHETHRRYAVGEWKFLQTAINHHAPRALDRIAALTAAAAKAGLTPEKVPAVHPTEPTAGVRPTSRHSSRIREKRARARDHNEARIARESAAGLAAQRGRSGAPRPGRG